MYYFYVYPHMIILNLILHTINQKHQTLQFIVIHNEKQIIGVVQSLSSNIKIQNKRGGPITQ